ncbi:MAG TPA: VanZ family protein [Vicinamibacterales bacterium]|nr:VanZ family protein [Vicinamibacterales bacterium]
MSNRLSLWLPPVAWMAAIFAVSSIPDLTHIPGGLPDSAAHGGEYAVLGVLLLRAAARGRWSDVTLRAVGLAVALSAAYAATDEWHQSFVPGRGSEVRDVAWDVAGASAAAGAAWAWGIIRRFSRPRESRHGVHEPPPRA